MYWRPVNTCDCSVKLHILLEDKFLGQFALLVLIVSFVTVILCEEIIHQVEFLAQSALNQSRTVVKELFEIFCRNDRFCFIFRHLSRLCLQKLLLSLALRTDLSKLVFFLNETCLRTHRRFSARWAKVHVSHVVFKSIVEFVFPTIVFVSFLDWCEAWLGIRFGQIALDFSFISCWLLLGDNFNFDYIR